jgi:cytochrome P450
MGHAVQTRDPRSRPRMRPPEARGSALVGAIPALRADAPRFLVRSRAQLGDVFSFRVGPRRRLFVAAPDDIERILVGNNANYRKHSVYRKMRPLLGNGLLTSDGESWLHQRRLIQPVFHRRRVEAFADVMVDTAVARLDERWAEASRTGRPLDVAAEMMRLTLTIVGRTLFSADVSGEAERVGAALTVSLRHANARMRAVLDVPEGVPTPANVRFARARGELDGLVFGLVRDRRARGLASAPNDLLTLLLQARDAETGQGMSDAQIRDEAMTLFLAGHETTANALTWTFLLLARHPLERRRLEAELDTVLAGRPPGAGDLGALAVSGRVVKEAMRLYPPAWAIGRRSLEADVLGGYDIPGGTDVLISAYVTHRHPGLWDDPEGFDPDRFLLERERARHRMAYIPFGGGPRLCIGNGFAMMEATLVLAAVAQRYRLTLVSGSDVRAEPTVTLRPRHGLTMRVHAR